MIYLKHILPLTPNKVINSEGQSHGTLVLGMLWLEKAVQILFRLRDMGIEDSAMTEALIDELHKVTRLREESAAHIPGTCVPEYSELVS